MTAGRARQVPRPFEGGDDQRLAPVGLLAAVEQVERFDDPPRRLMVLEGDRLLEEPGLGVGGGVPAIGDGHPSQVLRGGAGHVQVALGGHRHPLRRRQQPERRVPGEVGRLGIGDGRAVLHAGTEPVPRTLVEGPVADHDIGHAGGHGHGRLLDGAAAGAAAVVDAAEERQLADAQAPGDLDLRVGVGAEGHQSVDLGRLDAGVTEGEVDRLDGQAELAAPRLLGELGGSDAHDGRIAGERMPVAAHRADPSAPAGPDGPDGRSRRTVPVTWSPRLLAPRTVTSTAPRPSSATDSSLAVTEPVSLMVSSG